MMIVYVNENTHSMELYPEVYKSVNLSSSNYTQPYRLTRKQLCIIKIFNSKPISNLIWENDVVSQLVLSNSPNVLRPKRRKTSRKHGTILQRRFLLYYFLHRRWDNVWGDVSGNNVSSWVIEKICPITIYCLSEN